MYRLLVRDAIRARSQAHAHQYQGFATASTPMKRISVVNATWKGIGLGQHAAGIVFRSHHRPSRESHLVANRHAEGSGTFHSSACGCKRIRQVGKACMPSWRDIRNRFVQIAAPFVRFARAGNASRACVVSSRSTLGLFREEAVWRDRRNTKLPRYGLGQRSQRIGNARRRLLRVLYAKIMSLSAWRQLARLLPPLTCAEITRR